MVRKCTHCRSEYKKNILHWCLLATAYSVTQVEVRATATKTGRRRRKHLGSDALQLNRLRTPAKIVRDTLKKVKSLPDGFSDPVLFSEVRDGKSGLEFTIHSLVLEKRSCRLRMVFRRFNWVRVQKKGYQSSL